MERQASRSLPGLELWLAEHKAHGSAWAIEQEHAGTGTTHFVLYTGAPTSENEGSQAESPAQKLAQIQKRIRSIVEAMEHAIGTHEFEQARLHSDEEIKERENLRLLREQCSVQELRKPLPFLCIEVLRNDDLAEIQSRCDDYLAEGAAEVWLLDPRLKPAYTVNKAAGLREFKGEILQLANPPLELDLRKIFN